MNGLRKVSVLMSIFVSFLKLHILTSDLYFQSSFYFVELYKLYYYGIVC